MRYRDTLDYDNRQADAQWRALVDARNDRADASGADDADTLWTRGPEHAARTLAQIAVSERLGDVGDAAEDRQRERHAADWDVYAHHTMWWIAGTLPRHLVTSEMIERKDEAIRNARLLTAIEQGVRREAVADEAQRWRQIGRAAMQYTLARLAHRGKYMLTVGRAIGRAA